MGKPGVLTYISGAFIILIVGSIASYMVPYLFWIFLDPITANKISSVIQIIILASVGILFAAILIAGLFKTGVIPGLDVKLERRAMEQKVIRERELKKLQLQKTVADLKLEKEEEFYVQKIAKKMKVPVNVVRDKLKKPVIPLHIQVKDKPDPLFDMTLIPEVPAIEGGDYTDESYEHKSIESKNIRQLPQKTYNNQEYSKNQQNFRQDTSQKQLYSIKCHCGQTLTYVQQSSFNSKDGVPTHFCCRACGVY
ncbi:MAG: hypothetical protein ACFFDN_46130, partial [Candidatus Hodarchaeota archaeon]